MLCVYIGFLALHLAIFWEPYLIVCECTKTIQLFMWWFLRALPVDKQHCKCDTQWLLLLHPHVRTQPSLVFEKVHLSGICQQVENTLVDLYFNKIYRMFVTFYASMVYIILEFTEIVNIYY